VVREIAAYDNCIGRAHGIWVSTSATIMMADPPGRHQLRYNWIPSARRLADAFRRI